MRRDQQELRLRRVRGVRPDTVGRAAVAPLRAAFRDVDDPRVCVTEIDRARDQRAQRWRHG